MNRKFSLIELLITIAIIAILAGMMLPALNKARESAYAYQCAGNGKTLSQAMALYTSAYEDYLGPKYNPSANMRNWDLYYGIMIGCPTFKPSTGSIWITDSPRWNVFTCPKDPEKSAVVAGCRRRSYGMISNLLTRTTGMTAAFVPFKISRYRRPSSTYALVCVDYGNRIPDSGWDFSGENWVGGAAASCQAVISNPQAIGPNHNGNGTILYLDGHLASKSSWKYRYDAAKNYLTANPDIEIHAENFTE